MAIVKRLNDLILVWLTLSIRLPPVEIKGHAIEIVVQNCQFFSNEIIECIRTTGLNEWHEKIFHSFIEWLVRRSRCALGIRWKLLHPIDDDDDFWLVYLCKSNSIDFALRLRETHGITSCIDKLIKYVRRVKQVVQFDGFQFDSDSH